MTDSRIHSQAVSLQENEAFDAILTAVRNEAMTALVLAPAHETETIREHQSMVRAVDAIRERAKLLALTTAPKGAPGLA